MKFTFHLPIDHVHSPDEFQTAAAVAEMVQGLERAGIDAVYTTDHPAPADPWLASGGHHAMDPFVALAFAAAASTKILLHTNIIVIPYRNPFMTAKSVASLDVLSGGRVIMGIGSGYLEGEFKALGATFNGRGALMDESIELMKQVWTGQSVKFQGEYFQADGNTALPTPLQKPHPPIWVGGNSERAMRRAVETCDGWAPFPVKGKMTERVRTAEIVSAAHLKEKIQEAKDRAAEIGRTRPFDVCMTPFGLTMQSGIRPDVSAVVDGLSELSEIGVTWSSIAMPCRTRSEYLANVDWFAREVIGALPA